MRAMTAVGVGLFALGLASCVVVPPPLEINDSADASRVTLASGQALKVTVEANPATDYRWVIVRGAAAWAPGAR